jgi:hypothetical protein
LKPPQQYKHPQCSIGCKFLSFGCKVHDKTVEMHVRDDGTFDFKWLDAKNKHQTLHSTTKWDEFKKQAVRDYLEGIAFARTSFGADATTVDGKQLRVTFRKGRNDTKMPFEVFDDGYLNKWLPNNSESFHCLDKKITEVYNWRHYDRIKDEDMPDMPPWPCS